MIDAGTQESRDPLVQSMIDLISNMAKSLVDSPGEVSVEAQSQGEMTVLLLRVSQADLGKVIGKQGRTARSMRTILGAASMKAQHRFSLDIEQVGRVPADLPDAPG